MFERRSSHETSPGHVHDKAAATRVFVVQSQYCPMYFAKMKWLRQRRRLEKYPNAGSFVNIVPFVQQAGYYQRRLNQAPVPLAPHSVTQLTLRAKRVQRP